jgi:hypothetical protein
MRTMRILAVAVVAVIIFAAPLTLAQKLDRDDGRSASRIASQFTRLAGSDDNALALVNALRAGERVTLVSGAEGEKLPVTTTFELPTGPMDWDNVVISLALARDSLARAGIAQPSAEELEAALLGGDVRTARGTVRLTGALIQ